ncbi:hypothetical protein H4Q32_005813 [Labeo rohita]|uniref:DUF1279 domain-containing protein n=1 Tax=Labeo rohita TaxID=84645 RepID=A0ABQ8LRM5_LABRO|nr:hypothetical protein H4Q32_005813 [Labeo rohita]
MQRFVCARVFQQTAVLLQISPPSCSRPAQILGPKAHSRWKCPSSSPRWLCSPASQKNSSRDHPVNPDPGQEEPDPLQDNSIGLIQRFKKTFKQYGKVMIPVHLVTSTVWFARYEPGPAPAPRNTVKTTWQRVAENYFQRKHLRNKHPEEWEKCNRLRSENGSSSTPAKKQTTLPESFTNCVPYDKNGARWKAITEAITFYIATDMLPIYSVEKRGFNHMLKVLDARGVNLVPFLEYVGFPDKVVKLLENSQSGYALTAYAMYKIATPARYTVTLGGTSLSVKYLRRHGHMSTPPPVKEYLQEKMEETKERISGKMEETKDRISERMEETKDKFTEKLQETKDKVSFRKKKE